MKIKEKIPYFIIFGVVSLLIYSSCANQGTPTGGPRDSIPPVLLRTDPGYKSLNFKGDEIRFTFNEYVLYDKVMEFLVVSPPLENRPTIRIKSKTLILKFNEELKDSATYSIDFKNSIEDNNERNPLESLRFSFSTWDKLDTLRIAGVVLDANSLNRIGNGLVLLYKNTDDTAIYRSMPDYIAKTNGLGIFLMDNIAAGSYRIYTINDANSDLKYNEGVEEIGYYDSLVVPEVYFVEEPDTVASGADSLLISGHYHFLPEPIYLRSFMEDIFSQFLTSAEREANNKCRFIFEESVKDTFGIKILNYENNDWFMLEPNLSMDTISLWITDTMVAKLDTVFLELMYNQIDSSGQYFIEKDTVDLIFADEEPEIKPERKNRRDDKEESEVVVPPIKQFSISDNLKTNGFDLNKPVYLKIPEPVKLFNFDMVHLYLQEDTTGSPLKFKIVKDTTAWRWFRIDYKWEPNTDYRLEVDSAACENVFGITNRRLMRKFKTQKDDYYGSIILTATNVNGPVILQLLSQESEKIVQTKKITSGGLLTFEFLQPGKYVLKAIYDENDDGKWNTGDFKKHIQPERIAYFQKVFKIRSNWEQKEAWDLTPDPTYPKEIFDQDAEDRKKEAAKENRNNNQNNRNSGNIRNNLNSGSSGTNIRRQ